MSKLTIVEGNSNDKDNTRAFMVKGESGVSPTLSASRSGTKTTVTMTDYEGTHTFDVNDGVSPTVEMSKTAGVTTITITDASGTHTSQISDGGVIYTRVSKGITVTSSLLQVSVDCPTGYDSSNSEVIAISVVDGFSGQKISASAFGTPFGLIWTSSTTMQFSFDNSNSQLDAGSATLYILLMKVS